MQVARTSALPRLVIGAPQGRSGKTTVSLGLCAALRQRGLNVQPFKKGPDFIDPSWLSAAAGRPCRTLDPFFNSYPGSWLGARLRESFLQGMPPDGFGLVEGNHGLYDSAGDETGEGSTAALARHLSAPIILVVNAARMSRSVAAMVRGYQVFEPDTPIAGVILNHVAGAENSSSRHLVGLRRAIEQYCGIPVLGALPVEDACSIPDRHLGLVPHAEDEHLLPAISACQQAIERYVDVSAVINLANQSPPLPVAEAATGPRLSPVNGSDQPRIGVLRDRSFSFYYPENLEALEKSGATLVGVDALRDRRLPGVQALYIGGGFPEMFLSELEANRTLRQEIFSAIQDGMPVYAECGGLMYLCRSIRWRGETGEMVGVFPFDVEVLDRPQGHGYVALQVDRANAFFLPGTALRGHEFHHSRLQGSLDGFETVYRLERGAGLGNKRDGLVYKNVLAAYTHLHCDGAPGWAAGLVSRAKQFGQQRAAEELRHD